MESSNPTTLLAQLQERKRQLAAMQPETDNEKRETLEKEKAHHAAKIAEYADNEQYGAYYDPPWNPSMPERHVNDERQAIVTEINRILGMTGGYRKARHSRKHRKVHRKTHRKVHRSRKTHHKGSRKHHA